MKSLFKSLPNRLQLAVDQLMARCHRALQVETKQRSAPNLEPMEERIMMSASPMAMPIEGGEAQSPTVMIFVDESVPEFEAISKIDNLNVSADDHIQLVTLTSGRDGVEQISEVLETMEEIRAIHVITHGNSSGIQIGDTFLDNTNLTSHAGSIAKWKQALATDADLLIYGCNLASEDSGRELLEGLSELSGADVAASDDLTGHSSLGGDWELEFATGLIQHGELFGESFQSQWDHVLEVTVDATTTAASIKNATVETVSHTTAGTERLLLVGVSYGDDMRNETASVTYNGQDLFKVGERDNNDDNKSRVEIWALVDPDLGMHDLVVNYGGSHEGATIGVMSFNGVDTSSPLGAFASQQGDGSNVSVTVASNPGELVFSVAAFHGNSFADLDHGADQTEYWNLHTEHTNGAGSLQDGDSSVDATWTTSDSDKWVAAGVSIKPSNTPKALTTTSELLVNEFASDTQITSAAERGSQNAVAMNDVGDYVVVWSDSNSDGSGWGISAQRFDSAGNRIGPEIGVNSESLSDQQHASVAMDASGRFIVVWKDDNSSELVLRRFNADGQAIDLADVIVTGSQSGEATNPTVAVNRQGQIVIAWQSDGSTEGIYARAFDMNETLSGGIDLVAPIITVETHSSASEPSVDINDSGRFVAAWAQDGQLYGRRFDFGSLSALSARHDLNFASFGERQVVVAVENNNDFVIAYRSDVTFFQGIWTHRFNADGSAIASPTLVEYDDSAEAASIAMDRDDNYIVTYQTNDGSGEGVYARKFDSNGAAQGSSFRINETTNGDQHHASIAMLDLENFVVVWSGNGEQPGEEDSEGVFSRQLGTLLSTSTPVGAVSDSDTNQNLVAEDAVVGAYTGLTAAATDSDGDTLTYSLIRDADGRFEIDSVSGAVNVAGPLDYETASSHTVRVQVDSSDGSRSFQSFTINVSNVNEFPVVVDDYYSVAEGGTLNTLSGSWWDDDWGVRQQLTIDNTTAAEMVHVPILITLDGSNIDYSKTQNNGQDLRFVDEYGRLLNHEIENWDESGVSQVWVRVPKVSAGSSPSIWMYYDNETALDGSNPENTWANRYQGVYHLHNDRLDSTSNGVDPVAANTVDETGAFADGERFDGDTSFVNLGSNGEIDDLFYGGGTVSAWVKLDSYGENGLGRIFDKSSGVIPSPNGWSLSVDEIGPGQGRLIFEQGYSNEFGRWTTTGTNINLSAWHHVALVFDSSNPLAGPTIYLDGSELTVNQSNVPQGTLLSDAGLDLAIGNHMAGGNRGFDGVVDEVRLSNRAFNDAHIKGEYRSGIGTMVSFLGEENPTSPHGVLQGDYDPDGDSLTISKISDPLHGTLMLNNDGSFTYVHDGTENFNDSFVYRIADGNGGFEDATVHITITDINDAPLVNLGNLTNSLPENFDTTSATKVADIVITDDALGTNTVTLAGADAALFELANGDTELRLKSGVVLDHETNPSLDVTVVVSDAFSDGGPNSVNHSIAITDINESPTIALSVLRSSIAENADTTSRIKLADIVVSDDALGSNDVVLSGADAAMFELSLDQSELFLVAGASLDFESAPQLDVIVSVDDMSIGSTEEDSVAYSLDVTNVNESLFAAADSYYTTVDTSLNVGDPLVGVRQNDTTVGGAAYTGNVVKTTDVQFGTLTLYADGTFDYIPNPGFEGLDFFEYEIDDGVGNVASGTATIQVHQPAELVSTGEMLVNQESGPHEFSDQQTTNRQDRGSDSAIAIAQDGTKVVVWTSESGDGVDDEVFMRLYDYRGIALGPQQIVSNTTIGSQHSASVAMDGSGNFVVVWVSENQDGTASSIYARRFNAAGRALGDEFRVTDAANSSGIQANPDIASNDAGMFVIAWTGEGVGDSSGIFGRIFNTDGGDVSGVFRANDGPVGDQNIPSAGIDDAGNAVFGWSDPANDNIQLRRFDSMGSALSGEVDGPLNVTTLVGGFPVAFDVDIVNVSLNVRGDGFLSVAATAYAEIDSGNWAVSLAALPPDLSTVTNIVAVDVNQSGPGNQQNPSVSFLDNGDAIVTWEGPSDASDFNDSYGVYARKFSLDTSGPDPYFNALGNEFTLNQTLSGIQSAVSVAALDVDNFAVVWSGNGAGDGNGVFLRQFGTLSNTYATDDIAVVQENQSLIITIADLLDDDFDGTGGGLILDSFVQPTNGTLTDNGDGTLTYVPELDFNGVDSFDYTIRSGGQTAIGTVFLAVTPANSAPVLNTSLTYSLNDMSEDDEDPAGTLVSDILSSGGLGAIFDADPSAQQGIAVVGLDTTNGEWQFSTDGGGSWTDFGVVSEVSSTLLASDNLVRFLPNENYFGNGNTLTFRAWDQTQGAVGDTGFEILNTGSPHAFSGTTATAEQVVLEVNDTPMVATTVDPIVVEEDADDVLIELSGLFSDVEDVTFNYSVFSNSNNTLVSTSITGSTLTISFADDQHGSATIVIRATDSGFESADLPINITVNPENDAPQGTLSIAGTLAEDQTLTASNAITDDDGLGTVSFQWQRDGVDIVGATSATYVLGDDDVGTLIRVIANYTDDDGTNEEVTSSAVGPVANVNDVPTGSVVISGTAVEDQVLTVADTIADDDGLGLVSYRWQRDGIDIPGANGSSYNLGDDDVGAIITVVASYTDDHGTDETVVSNAVGPVANVNDEPIGSVDVSGTATEDETLTASFSLTDADGLGPVSIQWMRDGVAISGATSSTYTLDDADVGTMINAVANYIDLQGTPESVATLAVGAVANVNDLPIGSVDISGTVVENQTLTASHVTLADDDGLGTVSYQWQRDGVDISGATGTTYTLGADDVGAMISVVASYVDLQGTPESVSSLAVGPVGNENDLPTGLVLISGTPAEDQTLVATNTLADKDGLGIVTYQWQRDGVDISGATGTSYTLGDDDVGTMISVVASYVDLQGTSESVSSLAVGAVANVNDLPMGTVDIGGTVVENQTLAASHVTLVDRDGLGTISYLWRRNGVDIIGATGSTYTLGGDDVGTMISVVASYVDLQGTPESVASSVVGPVGNENDLPTGMVLVSGTPAEGQTLVASNTLADKDGLGVITYQWQRNGVDIGGAAGSSYTLSDNDGGSMISVVASYTDGYGTDESVSSAPISIANVNDVPVVKLANIVPKLNENTDTSLAIRVADIIVVDDLDGINVLSLSGDDASHFEIDSGQLLLRAGTVLDFETQQRYEVAVEVNDTLAGGAVDGKVKYTLQLVDVNEAPVVIKAVDIDVDEDQTGLVYDLNSWFEDQDLADMYLDFSVTPKAGWIHTEVSTSNQLTLELDTNRHGMTKLLVRATDHAGLFVEQAIDVTVRPQNDTVVVGNQRLVSLDGNAIVGKLVDTVIDADGESISIVVTEAPDVGSLKVFNDGSFEFQPDDGFFGEVKFRFVADDGVAVSNEGEVVIETIASAPPVVETTSGPVEVVEEVVETETEPSFETEPESEVVAGSEQPEIEPTPGATRRNQVDVQQVESVQELDAVDHEITDSVVSFGQFEYSIDRAVRSGSDFSIRDLASDFALQTTSYATAANSSLIVLTQPGMLWNDLDAFMSHADSKASFDTIAIGSVGTVSSGLIVGYVVWAIRSGLLLSSVIASMPVWNFLDPMAIVSVADGQKESDTESLEDIIDDKNSDKQK